MRQARWRRQTYKPSMSLQRARISISPPKVCSPRRGSDVTLLSEQQKASLLDENGGAGDRRRIAATAETDERELKDWQRRIECRMDHFMQQGQQVKGSAAAETESRKNASSAACQSSGMRQFIAETEEEINGYRERIGRLEKEAEEKTESSRQLSKELFDAKLTEEKLALEVENLKTSRVESNDKRARMKAAAAENGAVAQQLAGSNKELKKELAKHQSQEQRLRADVDRCREENGAMRKRLQAAAGEAELLTKERNSAAVQCEAQARKITLIQDCQRDLQKDQEAAKKELISLRGERDSLAKEKADLRVQLDSREQTLDGLNRKMQQFPDEEMKLRDAIVKLNTDLKAVTRESEVCKETLSKQSKKMEQMKTEHQGVHRYTEQLKQRANEMSEKAEQRERQLSETKRELQDATAQRDELQSKCELAHAYCMEIESSAQKMRVESQAHARDQASIHDLTAKVQKFKAESGQRQEEISMLQTQILRYDKEQALREKDFDNLRRELDRVKGEAVEETERLKNELMQAMEDRRRYEESRERDHNCHEVMARSEKLLAENGEQSLKLKESLKECERLQIDLESATGRLHQAEERRGEAEESRHRADNLARNLSVSEARLADVADKLQAEKKTCARLSGQLSHSQDRNKQLEEENRSTKTGLLELRTYAKKANADMKQMHAENAQLTDNNRTLANQLQALNGYSRQASQKISATETSLQQLQDDNQTLAERLEESDNSNRQHQATIEDLQQRIATGEAQVNKMEADYQAANAARESARQELQAHGSERSQLEQAVKELTADHNRLQMDLHRMAVQCRELNKRNASIPHLSEKLEAEQKTNRDLLNKEVSLTADLRAAQERVAGMEKELAGMDQERATLEHKHRMTAEELDKLNKTANETQKQGTERALRNEQLQRELADARASLAEMQMAGDYDQKNLCDLESYSKQADERIDKLEAALSASKFELERTTREKHRVREETLALTNQVNDLTDKMEAKSKLYTECKEAMLAMRADLQNNVEERGRLRSTCRELKGMLEGHRHKESMIAKQGITSHQEVEILREKLSRSSGQLLTCQEQCVQMEQGYEKLNAECQTLLGELFEKDKLQQRLEAELEQTGANLAKSRDDHQADASRLERELCASRQQTDELAGKHSEIAAKRDSLLDEQLCSKKELAEANRQLSERRLEYNKVELERHNLQNKCTSVEAELRNVTEACAEAQQKRNDFGMVFDAARSDNDSLKSHLEQVQAEKTKLKVDLDNCEASKSKLSKELTETKHEMQRLCFAEAEQCEELKRATERCRQLERQTKELQAQLDQQHRKLQTPAFPTCMMATMAAGTDFNRLSAVTDSEQKRMLDKLDSLVKGMASDCPRKSNSFADEFNKVLKDIKQDKKSTSLEASPSVSGMDRLPAALTSPMAGLVFQGLGSQQINPTTAADMLAEQLPQDCKQRAELIFRESVDIHERMLKDMEKATQALMRSQTTPAHNKTF